MKKNKNKKIIISLLILTIIGIGAGFGFYMYHKQYQKKFKFTGLGDIYQNRSQQYKLFTERKLTLNNKGNPPKYEVKNMPSFKVNFRTTLNDGTFILVKLDFRFENAKGIKEIRRKWERIDFASSLALSAYSAKDLDKKGKSEVLVILENQIRKRVFSPIKYIYLDMFDLNG